VRAKPSEVIRPSAADGPVVRPSADTAARESHAFGSGSRVRVLPPDVLRERVSESQPSAARESAEKPMEVFDGNVVSVIERPDIPVVKDAEPIEARPSDRPAEAVIAAGAGSTVREHPSADPTSALFGLLRELDLSAFVPPEIPAEVERREWGFIESRLATVADLIDRLTHLPLVAEPEKLAAELTVLGRTDIRDCLRRISQACRDLGAPDLRWEDDTDGWISLLDVTIQRLEQRGTPEVQILPGPAGDLEGSPPTRPIDSLTVRDSRAITYGIGNTLHVVHHCAVERPVIEVASLIDYDEATDTEAWCHSLEPVRAAGTEDMRTRITRSAGVSIGVGNHQNSVFTHRIGPCAVNLGVVVASPRVRQAIIACRLSGGTPEAMTTLRKAVRGAVDGIDVSALVPDSMVTRLAAAQAQAPSLRGRGPTLTIRHGAGISVGWNTTMTSVTRIDVGKPRVQ
jgi:hypothetical protein